MSIRSYWVVKYTIESNPEKVEEIDVDLETETVDFEGIKDSFIRE